MGAVELAAVAVLGQAEAPRLDPLHPWGADEALLHSLVHEVLVQPIPGAPGWRSDLVSVLEVEGAEVQLVLERGLRWHDGEQVGADDVCATIARLSKPGSSSTYAPGVQHQVVDCTVVEERTAKVTLVAGADWRRALAVPLVPAHLQPTHAGDPRARQEVGCGPYAAVKAPWGWVLSATGPSPYPELRWVGGVPARVASDLVAEGRVLAAATAEPAVLSQLRGAGVPLLPWDRPVAWAIALDPSRPPFDDVRVRRAVDHLLDRDRLAQVIAATDGVPLWPRASGPWAVGSDRENRSVVPTPFDPDGAAALLKQAGLSMGLERIWTTAEGEPLTLRIGVPWDMGFEPAGVRSAWAPGIDIEVVALDRSEWVQGALGGGRQGHLDGLLVPRDLSRLDDPVAWFHHRGEGGGWLSPFDSDGDLDELARHARTDVDAARELHGALHEAATWLFLFEERRPSAWREAQQPWWTSPDGWGRIDRWGRP